MKYAALAAAFFAAAHASAQGAPEPSKTLEALEAAADGVELAGETFDGMPVLRHQKPGLVVLKEEKNINLGDRVIPGHPPRLGGAGSRYGEGPTSDNYRPAEPDRVVSRWGNRFTYGIADRGAFAGDRTLTGLKWGSILGAIVAVAGAVLTAIPVTHAIGVGVLLAGALGGPALGAGIGALFGALTPRVFEDEDVEREEVKNTRSRIF